MVENTPFLTVVVPNYNHAHYLRSCLDSLLEQDYDRFEVLVVDDGSTDGSQALIQDYINKSEHVRAVFKERNEGMLAAIRSGLVEARGKYILSRASDDVSYQGHLRKSVEMMERYPHAAFCCSDMDATYDDFKSVEAREARYSESACYLSPEDLAEVLGPMNPMWSHTAVVRRELYLAIPFDNPDLSWLWDYFWNNYLASQHGICYIPEVLSGARYYPEQLSYSNTHREGVLDSILRRIIDLIVDDYPECIPFFARCRIFNAFYAKFVEIVQYDRKYWRPEVQQLMVGPYHEWNERLRSVDAQFGLASRIRRKIKSDLAFWKELVAAEPESKILVYGAGEHTRWLLRVWAEFGLPIPDGIVVSSETHVASFEGIPISSVGSVAPEKIAAVIVSSASYEREMSEVAKSRFPDAIVYTFWNTRLSTMGSRTCRCVPDFG